MKKEMLEEITKNQKSLIVGGDIASGKTTNVIFPLVSEMIDKKESMFILDSREEYINEYYDKLKENNYNVVIINLRDLDKSEGWNPLEYPYSLHINGILDKAQEYIERIGRTMFYENTNSDPFWSIAASDFLTGVTLGLFEDGSSDEINLNSVNNMFNGVDVRYGASDYISTYFNLKQPTSVPFILASTTFLAPKDTKGSILSVARQKLRLFVSREKLSKLLNKTTFKWGDVLNKPSAIIFINKDENKSLNSLSAIFVEQLYNILIDNKANNKFNFVLDNFDSIEKVNELIDMLGSCTSRNIKFIISTRSIEDLSLNYGNYINKLCNMLIIEDNSLKLNINGQSKSEEKDFTTKKIEYKNIDYPKLNDNVIKYFDIQQYVKSKKKDMLFDLPTPTNLSGNPFDVSSSTSVDKLISDIDKKIEEIETEKFKDIKKNANKEDAELAKFKVEEN